MLAWRNPVGGFERSIEGRGVLEAPSCPYVRDGPVDQPWVGQVSGAAFKSLAADEFTDALPILVEQVMEVPHRNMVCRGDCRG